MPRDVSLEKTRNIGIMHTLTLVKLPPPSVSCSILVLTIRWVKLMTVAQPWTGWSRSRSVVSPLLLLLPPVIGLTAITRTMLPLPEEQTPYQYHRHPRPR